ncbi:TPA: replication initiation protein, partial [Staphylococcus pseudintermedius]
MSEKEHKSLTNQRTMQVVTNYTSTGYSNSRLDGQTLGKSQPELSFDAMTIVGNLNKTNAKKLSDFMSTEPQIRLWDMLQTKFKAKAIQEKVYIEYDKVKADTWDRR